MQNDESEGVRVRSANSGMYVHDITLYPDGSIEWAYSGGGRFET